MILLVSDLHLDDRRPDIVRAFLHLLETQGPSAQALYILGDLFEAWIGDDAMGPLEHTVAAALRRLADQGVALYLMHGNRDFLIGRDFCRQAGCTLLPDSLVVELAGQRALLVHGDTLCTQDESYQKLRHVLRNPVSLFILRHLPLTTRQKLALKLRNESRQQTRAKALDITDVTPAEVARQMRKAGVRLLIHGHTHRPADHAFELDGAPARRLVLGDWDRQGWVLEVNEHGLRQRSFALETCKSGN